MGPISSTCLWLAQSGHARTPDECPPWGAKRIVSFLRAECTVNLRPRDNIAAAPPNMAAIITGDRGPSQSRNGSPCLQPNKFGTDLVIAEPDHSALVPYTSCIIQNDGKFVRHIMPNGKPYAAVREINDGALERAHRLIDDDLGRAVQYPAR